ncbi:MAG: NAD(P)-dependent oxidoreductase [Chloroflexi bacterium]|nr:NAD(P)-dependent oxidoreductase [Chloroflexota bacterium]
MSVTVGLYSPGDMGSTVGRVLSEHGLRVVGCVQGRSERTRHLAENAEIELLSSYADLVAESDLILSILVPAEAVKAAEFLAHHFTGARVTYADCNAISPETTRHIGRIITDAGADYIDASIIGPPPHKPGVTRFYASGEHAARLAALNEYGLDVRIVSDEIGQASAVKMCYAALTKGTGALMAQLLIGAEALGIRETLMAEFKISQADRVERIERATRYVPAKARRYAGEMDEIARTFASVGLTPKIHEGAAAMYRFIGETPLADRNPEDPEPPPDIEETLRVLLAHLKHTAE